MRMIATIASPTWAPVREPNQGCCGIPGNKAEGHRQQAHKASRSPEQWAGGHANAQEWAPRRRDPQIGIAPLAVARVVSASMSGA